MKTVLITGIGGDIAQGVATIIRESRPEIRLIGTDVTDEHGGTLFVEVVCGVPFALSDGYLERIREIVDSYSIDLIIPMTEPELSVIEPLIDELGSDRFITAGKDVVSFGIDKLRTMEAITSLDIPAPWSVAAGKEVPLEFPCIFKTRGGSGSKDFFVVGTREESDFLMKRYSDGIFQELLQPANREVTCAVYRKRNGEVAVIQLLRKLMGGLTGWAEVIEAPELKEMCVAVAEGMNLRGSMNIQVIITEFGPRVFEINARFSSTVLMRHRIGFTDVLWALDEAEGKSFKFPEMAIGQRMVRVHDVHMIG
jgi:carbamoyl-phosphate synthase large subunit